ncbi:hypothetical protein GGR52DRAFT_180575 [Hypoxylon sp. FL1284]|nr:hypothetical protein GGR52DRAFT_180575 [Hypoxylon sp. FL1284]
MLQICTIISECVYCFAMLFIKLSILSLYGTIFRSKRFNYCLWAVSTAVLGWAITISLCSILQCKPIAFGWDETVPGGFCIQYGVVSIIAGVLNITTDIVILLLPVPIVWRLHISSKKKWLLSFTFGMGGSACVVSIVRLAYVSKVGTTADSTWDVVNPSILSIVELMAGFLAVSIPTYQPLYRRILHGTESKELQNIQRGDKYARSGAQYLWNTPRNVEIFATSSSDEPKPWAINVTNHIELSTHSTAGGSWVRVPEEGAYGGK